MFRERLREAIDMIEKSIDSLGPVLDYAAAKRVLAAARAYACERCNGTRIVRFRAGRGDTDYEWDEKICPDCKEWRRTADGGEE